MKGRSTTKRAEQAGLQMVEVDGHTQARLGEKVLAMRADPDAALDKALIDLEADRLRELDKRPEDREPVLVIKKRAVADAPVIEVVAVAILPKIIKGSIIKSKYKDKYKKFGYSCGDDIADELRAYLVGLKNGKTFVDTIKLKKVAEDNGVWRDSYALLNVGQQRMNIGNRLRNKYANGEKIDIGGAIWELQFD